MRSLWRLAKAFWMCWWGHRKQVDKAGVAYWRHPVRVAWIAWAMTGEVEAAVVGLLHDYIEDVEYVGGFGCLCGRVGGETACRVWKLTKRLQVSRPNFVAGILRGIMTADETYEEYIQRVEDEGDGIVLAVKMADLLHNTDPARSILSDIGVSRQERYLKALGRLTEARAAAGRVR